MAFRLWTDDGSLLVVFDPLTLIMLKKVVGVGHPLAKLSGYAHAAHLPGLVSAFDVRLLERITVKLDAC